MKLPEQRFSLEKDRVFLLPEEVLEAIREDFEQYPPQPRLFMNLCPLILGAGQAAQDARRRGAWVRIGSRGKMKLLDYRQLGRRLCDALEEVPPPLARLSAICRMVFQTRATPGCEQGLAGIWIETDMELFSCVQCGHCCGQIGYPKEAAEDDVARWRAAGREDILRWVGLEKRVGQSSVYRIWIEPGTNRPATACPWLKRQRGTHRYECGIHEVKPDICRLYPGSRKHAVMTGCRGFEKSG